MRPTIVCSFLLLFVAAATAVADPMTPFTPKGAETLAVDARLSVGSRAVLLYDPFDQKSGEAVQVEAVLGVTPHLALALTGVLSNRFELGNDLTEGEAGVSLVMAGGRWVFPEEDGMSGHVSLSAGALELRADNAAMDDDTISGGAARFGVGLQRWVSPSWFLAVGAGYTMGFGATNEVTLFDLSLGIGSELF